MPIGSGNKLILAFVTLMIGAVLIGTIATNTQATTTYSRSESESDTIQVWLGAKVNENVTNTLTQVPTGWKLNDCPITDWTIKAGNGTPLRSGTDYVAQESYGNFSMKNNSVTLGSIPKTNTTLSTYNYCGDDYLNSSWGRTVLNLIGGFFAIGLLLVSVALFFDVAKENGII